MLPRKAESPTGGDGAVPENLRWGSNSTSVSAPADSRTPRRIGEILQDLAGDLSRLDPDVLDVYGIGHLVGRRTGWSEGYKAGYRARAEDEAAEWQAVARSTSHLALALYGVEARRAERPQADTRTGAQIVADAHADWGLAATSREGRRYVA